MEVFTAHTAGEKCLALHETLQSKIDEFFPLKSIRLHHQDRPWMSPAIKSLIRARQQAFAREDLATWKLLRNKVQRKINDSKKSYYNNKIKALKKEHAAQWHKEIKAMANMGRNDPIINIEGLSPSDHRATADEINKTLAAVIQSLPPLDTSLLPAYLPAQEAPSIKPWEIYQKLQKVKTKKAAGPDEIPAKLAKEFAYELSAPLADVLNASLVQGSIPDEWKRAIVVPIPKSKPPSVNELRPISLTSILGKVAESFVAEWAVSDISNQVDPQQFGCLRGRSTTHCLLNLTDELFKATDEPKTLCSLVSTDFSKAFDRLQNDLTDLDKWSHDQHMVLHPKKCQVMHIHFSKAAPVPYPLYLNDIELQQVKVMRILGVFLQADLKWNAHVDHICSRASQRLYLLRKLKHFHVPTEDLVTVYVCYIRPVTEYAAPVWHPGLTNTQTQRIEKVQRRAVRIILGSDIAYSEACTLLRLPSLHERRSSLTLNFAKSLLSSELYRHFLPDMRGNISSRSTRSSTKLNLQRCRTERYRNSAIPHMTRLLNDS
ncbi:uncharacterized protein LOC144872371 [Branchiostoma floridae x Branchiostoma japonicum]